jgi:hypothetical protein
MTETEMRRSSTWQSYAAMIRRSSTMSSVRRVVDEVATAREPALEELAPADPEVELVALGLREEVVALAEPLALCVPGGPRAEHRRAVERVGALERERAVGGGRLGRNGFDRHRGSPL